MFSDERIICEMPDGSVEILAPGKYKTAADVIAHGDVPATAVSNETVDKSALPTDRYFRNAWTKAVGGCDIDMPKARIIHMDVIRRYRDRELARLDLEYMKADEDNDNAQKASIANTKRTLRDIPQTFDLSGFSTPEALKAEWPTEVPQP